MSESLAPHRERLLWLVAIAFFLQSLDATILNTALPAMAQSLGQSPLKMQSVIVAYSLTTAMLIPASGWVEHDPSDLWTTVAATARAANTAPAHVALHLAPGCPAPDLAALQAEAEMDADIPRTLRWMMPA